MSKQMEIYYEVQPDTPAGTTASARELEQMLAAGTIDGLTRVWVAGMSDWLPLAAVARDLEVRIGLGRMVALYHRSSTNRCLYF